MNFTPSRNKGFLIYQLLWLDFADREQAAETPETLSQG